jgi:hypothetical protein
VKYAPKPEVAVAMLFPGFGSVVELDTVAVFTMGVGAG